MRCCVCETTCLVTDSGLNGVSAASLSATASPSESENLFSHFSGGNETKPRTKEQREARCLTQLPRNSAAIYSQISPVFTACC